MATAEEFLMIMGDNSLSPSWDHVDNSFVFVQSPSSHSAGRDNTENQVSMSEIPSKVHMSSRLQDVDKDQDLVIPNPDLNMLGDQDPDGVPNPDSNTLQDLVHDGHSLLVPNPHTNTSQDRDSSLVVPNPHNSTSQDRQDDQDMLVSNSQSNVLGRRRYSSTSSISSVSSVGSLSSSDSAISEAKYGSSHGYDYDFCLWFTTANEKEADEIFKILEKEEKLRGFRYDRDLNATKYKLTNISDTIKSSWKIFLLVSLEALEDTWFENQMQQSLTHDITKSNAGVIPILLRLDRSECPAYLQSIFSLSYPSPPNEDSSSNQANPCMNYDRFMSTLLRVFEPRRPVSTKASSKRSASMPDGTSESSSKSSSSKSKPVRSASAGILSNIFKKKKEKKMCPI